MFDVATQNITCCSRVTCIRSLVNNGGWISKQYIMAYSHEPLPH